MSALRHWLSCSTAAQRLEMARLLAHPIWMPRNLPQVEALLSPADVLGYGGAAGGGKTDLLLGAALTQHTKSTLFRRIGTELPSMIERSVEIVGNDRAFAKGRRQWELPGRTIAFRAMKEPNDWRLHRGNRRDFMGFDEADGFLEMQVRTVLAWNGSTDPKQRVRAILGFNPPATAEGMWLIGYFAPWLDKNHPNPAQPGELRWFVNIDGKDVEADGPTPVEHLGKMIRPRSRSFIPARVEDNPFLAGTDYEATLDMLPEPLRSALRHGDFAAMQSDHEFQVIPTEWVIAAQERWRQMEAQNYRPGPMDTLAVDPARGGQDKTILSPRHGRWFAPLDAYPGTATPNGPVVAGLAVGRAKDGAPVLVDVIGIGSSVYDHLEGNGVHVVGLNGSEASYARDRSGRLSFYNLRAELWWGMREALDPVHGDDLALPFGDRELLADLTAPRWRLTSGGILIEDKEQVKKRIGRSPDRGDAVVYARKPVTKRSAIPTVPVRDDPTKDWFKL